VTSGRFGSRAFICGLRGTELGNDEGDALRSLRPWGVILFKRNVESLGQLRRLCDAVRESLGRGDAPILIDQEGGRVQRIGPPHLRSYPPGAAYGRLYSAHPALGIEAARLAARLIADDLTDIGISVDCLPILDVPVPDGTPAIGNRTLGETADAVSALGEAQIEGLLAGGVLPVIKHMPGHGRAMVDSHQTLPRVEADTASLEAQDFAPFRRLADRVPLGMTAHVVFEAIDPDAPATLSGAVIDKIIRGRFGFDGALMTDDISMGALDGTLGERAARAIAAGCDLVLHCNGELAEAEQVADAVPELASDALRRTEAALAWRVEPAPIDRAVLERRFEALIAQAAVA
jgi:beta-N-acetylhexosaminidase